jgi:transposase
MAAATQGNWLAVGTLPAAKWDFGLFPRREVVERSCASMARFRRLAGDDAWLLDTWAGVHCLAVAIRMLKRFVPCIVDR